MSRKFLTSIDLNKNEVQNARWQSLAAAPASPVAGLFYFDTVNNAGYIYNGTAWRPVDASKITDGSIQMSALATNPLARANHTGTQLAATISDLATTVKAYKLSDFALPTADVPMGGWKLMGLADPVNPQDASTKNYVDTAVQSAAAGIDSKASVRVVANANITLSGTQTIDGIAVVAGDRVLVRGQTTASANGVYVVAAGAWTRATDADSTGELTPGAFWFVEEGTTYGKTQWRIENTGTITLGTTSININQFGAAASYVAGNGLALAGNTFSVQPVASGGIAVGAGGVQLDTAVAVRKYAANVGDGAATSITVTHNLGTQDVTLSIRQLADNVGVECDWQANGVNTVVLTFAVAPALNALRVTIHG